MCLAFEKEKVEDASGGGAGEGTNSATGVVSFVKRR